MSLSAAERSLAFWTFHTTYLRRRGCAVNPTGVFLSDNDVEGLLREIASAGEAVEIDAAAGFRWNAQVA